MKLTVSCAHSLSATPCGSIVAIHSLSGLLSAQREQNDPESIYVNANYITDFFGRNGWIAAQGPTQRTLPAFVRMIWEQDVKTIVMLTKLKEGTKGKCEPYFPAKLNGTIRFESIEVTLRKSERKDGYVLASVFLLRDKLTHVGLGMLRISLSSAEADSSVLSRSFGTPVGRTTGYQLMAIITFTHVR